MRWDPTQRQVVSVDVVMFVSVMLCAFLDGFSFSNQTEKYAIQWKAKVTLVRREGIWGNEGISPSILNLDDRRKWVVNITPRQLYPLGKELLTTAYVLRSLRSILRSTQRLRHPPTQHIAIDGNTRSTDKLVLACYIVRVTEMSSSNLLVVTLQIV